MICTALWLNHATVDHNQSSINWNKNMDVSSMGTHCTSLRFLGPRPHKRHADPKPVISLLTSPQTPLSHPLFRTRDPTSPSPSPFVSLIVKSPLGLFVICLSGPHRSHKCFHPPPIFSNSPQILPLFTFKTLKLPPFSFCFLSGGRRRLDLDHGYGLFSDLWMPEFGCVFQIFLFADFAEV